MLFQISKISLQCLYVDGHAETAKLTPWSRVFLEKLLVFHLVKKCTPSMDPKGSFSYSQEPTTGPYSKPDESSPCSDTLFQIMKFLIMHFTPPPLKLLQNLNNIYRGTFVPKIKSINY
jgi:hypothetical protein